MGKFFVRFLQDSRFNLSFLCWILLRFIPGNTQAKSRLGVLNRILSASRFRVPRIDNEFSSELELLFVATQKDFSLLPLSINGALTVTRCSRQVSLTVVVPEMFISECKEIVDLIPGCRVISEDTLISKEIREMIFSKFAERTGWVIQQIVKLKFVLQSNSEGVLVVDSDTVLLKERDWLNEGTQPLLPVWELHEPYYRFLRDLGWSEIIPEFTFVAHHMLMQPQILRELFSENQLGSIENFVDYVIGKNYEDLASPFSIDYELYAQHLYRSHYAKIRFEKWSNLSLSRNQVPENVTHEWLIEKYGNRFASVSLHSYL